MPITRESTPAAGTITREGVPAEGVITRIDIPAAGVTSREDRAMMLRCGEEVICCGDELHRCGGGYSGDAEAEAAAGTITRESAP